MVAFDPRGDPSVQGPAVLPSLCRKRRQPVYRLCVGTESSARRIGGAGAPSAGQRDVRTNARRPISLSRKIARELTRGARRSPNIKGAPGLLTRLFFLAPIAGKRALLLRLGGWRGGRSSRSSRSGRSGG